MVLQNCPLVLTGSAVFLFSSAYLNFQPGNIAGCSSSLFPVIRSVLRSLPETSIHLSALANATRATDQRHYLPIAPIQSYCKCAIQQRSGGGRYQNKRIPYDINYNAKQFTLRSWNWGVYPGPRESPHGFRPKLTLAVPNLTSRREN